MSPAKAATTTNVYPEGVRPTSGQELQVVADIAHAFHSAAHPVEVYRLALARVTPLVGASFSSVFLRDPADPTLLKLECTHNWPQSVARFLGRMRVRQGRGPTGRAVASNAPVEVADIFADPSIRDWWDPARELGFASLISLPLAANGRVDGALSFYFDRPHRFHDDERRLLRLIADQLAATVARAHLVEELRAANERLRAHNMHLRRRIEEGEELRRLKDEFLANVSHELRTPLTSIIGYAQLLRDGTLGALAGEQIHATERIEDAGTVLLRLIGDLLDLTQLKLGRVPLDRSVHDATCIARDAAGSAGDPPANIAFDLRTPDSPLSVHTDGAKVVRILTNLLSNAFKFTPSGEVVLSVRGAGGDVCWEVRDTGIGIPTDEHEAIFDEFRQVDGSTTRLYGGTGLGLAISRRLAAMLGGTISVESAPGAGSCFTLRVPAQPPPPTVDDAAG